MVLTKEVYISFSFLSLFQDNFIISFSNKIYSLCKFAIHFRVVHILSLIKEAQEFVLKLTTNNMHCGRIFIVFIAVIYNLV